MEKTQRLVQDVEVSHVMAVKIEDFYESEMLGVACQPRCGSCRCGECPLGSKQYTLQQERELAMIDNGLLLKDGVWTAQYPWKRDPQELPNNYSSALAMMRSTERRMEKDPKLGEIYQQQIQDMIERGVARKLTSKEKELYESP
jgi:hypothetical protein